MSMGWIYYKGGEGVTYLLLHLADFEFMSTELAIILCVVTVPVLLFDDVLDLSHEGTAGSTDGLTSSFQAVLVFAHEGCLDTAGGNKLGSAGCHIVGCDNELLRRVATGDDTVSSLNQCVG